MGDVEKRRLLFQARSGFVRCLPDDLERNIKEGSKDIRAICGVDVDYTWTSGGVDVDF